ncbi:plasmid pRiA4b ORF-3 family protein [Hoeflea sp. CAU 1731]
MNAFVPDAARLRLTLHDLDPAPWRRIEVPLSMTFRELHDTIQAAFLWQNSHLWEFEIAGNRYGLLFEDDPDPLPVVEAGTRRLTDLRDMAIAEFLYIYDMGDCWEHHIEVEDLFVRPQDKRLPVFVDGKWRTPPEDAGGAPGFEAFLEIMADESHEEHDDTLEWYGMPFDPKEIELEAIKAKIARVARALGRKK